MDAIIDGIYKEYFKRIDEFLNDEERLACEKKILKEFKSYEEYAPLSELELYDKLKNVILECVGEYGLTQFKGGFIMGFKLAFECIKG